jgi:hypothetical protein
MVSCYTKTVVPDFTMCAPDEFSRFIPTDLKDGHENEARAQRPSKNKKMNSLAAELQIINSIQQ